MVPSHCLPSERSTWFRSNEKKRKKKCRTVYEASNHRRAAYPKIPSVVLTQGLKRLSHTAGACGCLAVRSSSLSWKYSRQHFSTNQGPSQAAHESPRTPLKVGGSSCRGICERAHESCVIAPEALSSPAAAVSSYARVDRSQTPGITSSVPGFSTGQVDVVPRLRPAPRCFRSPSSRCLAEILRSAKSGSIATRSSRMPL